MSDIFLKILNMSISAGWIVLVVMILRLVLRKAPKWINGVLWGIVGLRLVMPFSPESIFSLIPSAETISPGIMMDKTPEINSGIPIINYAVNPLIGESFTPDPGASANPLQVIIPVLSFVWLVGIIALLTYTVISYVLLKKKVETAVLLHDNIYQSENVVSPFVLGIIRPKIYLPFNMNGGDMQHVIAHEKAHIKRKDYLWKPLGFLLLTVYWFNPLIWLGYVMLCRDIELACDEKVVKELGGIERADYSQALLSCSVNRRMIAACPLAFGEVGVKKRIKSVLSYKKPAFWIVIAAAFISLAVAVCFLTNPPEEKEYSQVTTWKYSPMLSATFHSFYHIDFDFDYTYVATSCKNGMMTNLDVTGQPRDTSLRFNKGEGVYWTPNVGLEEIPESSEVNFTVYDGNKQLYYGSLVFKCVERDLMSAKFEVYLQDSNGLSFIATESGNIIAKLKGTTSLKGDDSNVMPRLVVSHGTSEITAWRGTSTWTYTQDDGTGKAINSDSSHPLERIDDIRPYAIYVPDPDKEPLVAKLKFDIVPDSIKVNSWFFTSSGKTKSFDADVDGLNINLKNMSEDCLYEVVAEWNSSDDFSGTIHYAFYVTCFSTEVVHWQKDIRKMYEETPIDHIEDKINKGEVVISKAHYQTKDGFWFADGKPYLYRLELTGGLNNAAKDTTYIVLSNSDDITFEQAWKSELSSLSTDIFEPDHAVIVGRRVF